MRGTVLLAAWTHLFITPWPCRWFKNLSRSLFSFLPLTLSLSVRLSRYVFILEVPFSCWFFSSSVSLSSSPLSLIQIRSERPQPCLTAHNTNKRRPTPARRPEQEEVAQKKTDQLCSNSNGRRKKSILFLLGCLMKSVSISFVFLHSTCARAEISIIRSFSCSLYCSSRARLQTSRMIDIRSL